MGRKRWTALAAALVLGGSAAAMAANDGQVRVDQLLGSDPEYRETWQDTIKGEERLPDARIDVVAVLPAQHVDRVVPDTERLVCVLAEDDVREAPALRGSPGRAESEGARAKSHGRPDR